MSKNLKATENLFTRFIFLYFLFTYFSPQQTFATNLPYPKWRDCNKQQHLSFHLETINKKNIHIFIFMSMIFFHESKLIKKKMHPSIFADAANNDRQNNAIAKEAILCNARSRRQGGKRKRNSSRKVI